VGHGTVRTSVDGFGSFRPSYGSTQRPPFPQTNSPSKATGSNSRFESQKSPRLVQKFLKIPDMKIPPIHQVCTPKVITISFIYHLLINP